MGARKVDPRKRRTMEALLDAAGVVFSEQLRDNPRLPMVKSLKDPSAAPKPQEEPPPVKPSRPERKRVVKPPPPTDP